MVEEPPKPKASAAKWISLGVTAGLVAAGIVYIVRHADQFAAVGRLSGGQCAAVSGLALVSLVLLGWSNKLVVRVFEIDLRFSEWFGLTMVGAMVNMFAPFAPGAGMRALYLKRVHGLAYVHFANCLAAPLLVGTMVNSLLALVALGLLWARHGPVSSALFALVLAAFLGPLALVLWPVSVKAPDRKWLRRLAMLVNGWRTVATNRLIVMQLGAAMAARALLLTVVYAIILSGIGVRAPLLACLTMASLGSVVRLINVTPGALGIYEGVLMAISSTFGIPPSAGMMVGLVHRLVSSVIILASGAVFSHILGREVAAAEHDVTR
jgi:uncharacterized membrane protein YbhN (UPF0104 family)